MRHAFLPFAFRFGPFSRLSFSLFRVRLVKKDPYKLDRDQPLAVV